MAEDVASDSHEYTHDAWLKHLEFIQAIITRMASNSFLLKGWTLTLSAALFSFGASHVNAGIATVSILPILAFWFLDAFFLRQERLYRSLYTAVANQDQAIAPFSLNASIYGDRHPWIKSFRSITLLSFYGSLTAAALLLIGFSLI